MPCASIQAVSRLCVSVCLLTTTATATAHAAPSQKKAIWGPATPDAFGHYRELGVGVLEQSLSWHAVAPTRPADPRDPNDPAYAWPPEIDAGLALAAGTGIRISLLVLGTPAWANGQRDRRWVPDNVSDFADFLEAASRRYPAVRLWMLWGEPTKASNFQPLASDHGRPLRGTAALRGPRAYARLLDAGYARLKSVSPRNLVIGGNTYTVGTVAPLHWIRALRLPNGRPPRMNLYGHNPFAGRRPDLAKPPTGHGFADFSDLDTLARAVDANLRRDRSRPGPKLFLSEFTLPTDHANFEFNFWLDRETQADWLRAALRITRGWSRIYTLGYLGLYDDPLRPDGKQVERGLVTRGGTRKPSFDAFRDG